jgi:hypothetical protein
MKYEDEEKPVRYNYDSAPRSEINQVFERFLRYNGINPDDVTLEKAEELLEVILS